MLSKGAFGQIIDTGAGIVVKKQPFRKEPVSLKNIADFAELIMEATFAELQAFLI